MNTSDTFSEIVFSTRDFCFYFSTFDLCRNTNLHLWSSLLQSGVQKDNLQSQVRKPEETRAQEVINACMCGFKYRTGTKKSNVMSTFNDFNVSASKFDLTHVEKVVN